MANTNQCANTTSEKKGWMKKLICRPFGSEKIPDNQQNQKALSPYNSLSPVDGADEDGHYSTALLWALQNREAKDIKNIALTGPYGSGKSSILKTFEKNNHDEQLVFLNISLATFKEEKSKGENEDTANDTSLLRLIELSILQQIFYHEEDDTIPDTRFKKTRSFPKDKVRGLAVGVSLFLAAAMHQFNPNLVQEKLRYTFPEWLNISLHYITLGLIVTGLIYLIWNSIRPLRSIQLKKFNFQDVEFGIDENISKSILNDHLDEILYFFEVTKYTVVVIEDLDRFEQTEIFTKLRELNHLINYSKKTKRKVSFVYAVRDDMFQDKDRTKFFDFIIPVIPVINSSNSNEVLLNIINENGYKINADLIDNVSFFVDDMRLLYNIMNEYHLYHKKLNVKDQNKLLAMIVYKNIYPNDFVKLSNGEGELFGVLNSKLGYIANKLNDLDEQINDYKTEIRSLESVVLKDVRELRKLYILEYLEQYPTAKSFLINNMNYTFTEVLDDDVFQHFIDQNVSYNYESGYSAYDDKITKKFKDIEGTVDPELNYAERLEHIENLTDGKIEDIKEKIAELEKQKNTQRHRSIKELLSHDMFELNIVNHKQKQLISILLRDGYIDENYLDYFSLFYEGSITKADKEFLLSVKAHIKTEFDYALIKIDKLISKLPEIEFELEYVLNYSLMNYIFRSGYSKQRSKIFKTLSNESDSSIAFIDGYLSENSLQIGPFAAQLAKAWPGIWKYLTTKSVFTEDRLVYYFNLIIAHADIKDIEKIASSSNLLTYIAKKEDFLATIANVGKLEKIIKILKIKFISLNLKDVPEERANFVVNGNYFELNELMAERVLKFKGKFSEKEYVTRNYTFIKTYAPQEYISYIDKNLNEYIANIWLPLEQNKHEEEKYLLELLNNETINDETKIEIIEKTETKINDLETIKNHDVDQELLFANKVVASWDNLIHYLSENSDEFDDIIIGFISLEENANELAKNRLNIVDPKQGKDVVQKIAKAFISQHNIPYKSYSKILDGIPYYYNNLNFVDQLSKDKIQLLVEKGKFGVNETNFNYLKEKFNGLQISLIERIPSRVISNLDAYNLDTDDAVMILSSSKFTVNQKNTIVNNIPETSVLADKSLISIIEKQIINEKDFIVSKEIVSYIVSSASIDIALPVLNKNFINFSASEIKTIIGSWPHPYSEITSKGKRPRISGTSLHWEFIKKLHHAGIISKARDEKGDIRISTFLK